jgi:CBS domain-containing protein
MTPFPYSIEIDEPVSRAKEMMSEHEIRHLPVIDRGKLVSVITDTDVKVALHPRVSSAPPSTTRVRDICVRGAYIVALSEPLDRVLLHMAKHHIDAALVEKDSRLAGIFTMTDACRSFGEWLRTLFPSGGDDQVA